MRQSPNDGFCLSSDQHKTSRALSGTSAGGFQSYANIDKFPKSVRGIISFNRGRCGSRGAIFNGIIQADYLVRRAAKKANVPILFIASTNDTVIPAESTRRFYQTACSARGESCSGNTFPIEANGVSHSISSTANTAQRAVISFLDHLK